MQTRFVRLEWENGAHTIGTAFFKPDKPYYFTAGQYADLTVPHHPADSRGLTRTMTITTAPSDQFIGITTRFDSRIGTYKQALLRLEPNDSVNLSDAMGDLVLPLDNSIPLVFVAGGVGIASYTSMLRYLTERKDSRAITLLYAVRGTDDIVFQNVVDTYAAIGKINKILFTTDHKADSISWGGTVRRTRLTAAAIAAAAGPDAQVYLSGSQKMVEQLRQELDHEFRVPQYRIAFDYFDGYVET